MPKVRSGSYDPSLLQPRRRAEQALRAVVQEAYVHGVSTRKVDELVKALGLDGEQIESLHELGFFDRGENVILLGPPGVGK